VCIGQLDDIGDDLFHLGRDLRTPCGKFCVQLFRKLRHVRTVPPLLRICKVAGNRAPRDGSGGVKKRVKRTRY